MQYKKLPEALSDSELKTIWSYADEYLKPEYQFVFRALYYTGCRISEFCYGFYLENIDLEKNQIKLVKCKFKKERIIPILPAFRSILQDWLSKQRRTRGFISVHMRNFLEVPLNHRTIERVLMDIGRKILFRRLHPHLFRATILTDLDRQGFSKMFLMDFAGHTSFTATTRYIRLNIGHMQQEIKNIYSEIEFDDKVNRINANIYKQQRLKVTCDTKAQIPDYIG